MDPRIAHVIARMEQHLDEPLTVRDLAADVNLSVSRLTHLFTRATGMPPARYLHHLRLRRARTLIERTFLTVKQVMTQVGINDPSHFSRDFRRYHGIPPSRLRQSGWAANAPRE
jgi:AraC family transcriptional regulator of arabinose operon